MYIYICINVYTYMYICIFYMCIRGHKCAIDYCGRSTIIHNALVPPSFRSYIYTSISVYMTTCTYKSLHVHIHIYVDIYMYTDVEIYNYLQRTYAPVVSQSPLHLDISIHNYMYIYITASVYITTCTYRTKSFLE